MQANRIREIREDRGLTQEQLAERCNSTKATISKLELSQRGLSQTWLYRLATALECHWVELIEDTPVPRDRYGRVLATCYLDGDNLNARLVAAGWALAYRRFTPRYVAQEEAARDTRRGLWAGTCAPPWEWRRREK